VFGKAGRVTTTISLTDLTARGAVITPAEAVAIVQTLIQADSTASENRQPLARPSFATIRLSSHGSVVCVGCAARLSTITEAALLLRELLPEGRQPIPGGLQYAIARALHEVVSRPFESLDELSRVLSRYEAGATRDVVRALVARARRPGRENGADRRRSAPSVADLRRQLRDADRERFELRAALHATASQPRRPVAWPSGQGAVAACLVAGLSLIGAGQLMRERTAPAVPAGGGDSHLLQTVGDAPLRPRAPHGSLPAPLPAAPAPANAEHPTMISVSADRDEELPPLADPDERTPHGAADREPAGDRSGPVNGESRAPGRAAPPADDEPRRESRARPPQKKNAAKSGKQLFEPRTLARIRFEW
jgi:hypothetical protein